MPMERKQCTRNPKCVYQLAHHQGLILIFTGCRITHHTIVASLRPIEPSKDGIREPKQYEDCNGHYKSFETVDLDYARWV